MGKRVAKKMTNKKAAGKRGAGKKAAEPAEPDPESQGERQPAAPQSQGGRLPAAQQAQGGRHPAARAPAPGRASALVDTRVVWCGDCLEQLANLPDKRVDLVYIDPPFNSNRNYVVFWGETNEKRAFEDRHASTQAYIDYMRPRCGQPKLVYSAHSAARLTHDENS